MTPLGKMFFGQMPVIQMTVDQSFGGQMTFRQMPLSLIFVDQEPIVQMSLRQLCVRQFF